MAHTELNLRERRTIEDMLNAKLPVRVAFAATCVNWQSQTKLTLTVLGGNGR